MTQFPTKSILQPIVLTETTRQYGSNEKVNRIDPLKSWDLFGILERFFKIEGPKS